MCIFQGFRRCRILSPAEGANWAHKSRSAGRCSIMASTADDTNPLSTFLLLLHGILVPHEPEEGPTPSCAACLIRALCGYKTTRTCAECRSGSPGRVARHHSTTSHVVLLPMYVRCRSYEIVFVIHLPFPTNPIPSASLVPHVSDAGIGDVLPPPRVYK